MDRQQTFSLAMDAADVQLDLETLAYALTVTPVTETPGRMPWRDRLRIMAREVSQLADLLAEAGREQCNRESVPQQASGCNEV